MNNENTIPPNNDISNNENNPEKGKVKKGALQRSTTNLNENLFFIREKLYINVFRE